MSRHSSAGKQGRLLFKKSNIAIRDEWDKGDSYPAGDMLYKDLTEKIIAAAFEVSNELGCGFFETVYERSFVIALQQMGLKADSQVAITVKFRDHNVGHYCADIVVDDKIIIELKAVNKLTTEHIAQVLNYLKATGLKVGLLINFRNSKLEYRRLKNYLE